MAFSPWPSYTDDEVLAVASVLKSNAVNYWTGSIGKAFETEFAEWCGVKHAVAVSNGTLALELALRALGIGVNDEVIVTPRTFFGTVSAIVSVGAIPVFVDVDPDSQNITADSIYSGLTKKTKAVICVHLAGLPCDMDPIIALSEENDLYIVEDCAQAHGAQYKGRSVGSMGHIGAWSFCQDKIMTTGGEGGMLTTNDQVLWERLWSYKDHGKSYDDVYNINHPPGFRWLHRSFGSNARMTEMQAAIGQIQLKKIAQWHEKRLRNANKIWSYASALPGLRVPAQKDQIVHAAYKCYVFVVPEQLTEGWDRDRVMQSITEKGVPCFSGSCSEVYLEKAFEKTEFKPDTRLPEAKTLGETSLMFLVHPTLTEKEIRLTCDVLAEVMTLATK